MKDLNRILYTKRKFKIERGPYRYFNNCNRPTKLYQLYALIGESLDYVAMCEMKYRIYQD
jgi:hypothetical protein